MKFRLAGLNRNLVKEPSYNGKQKRVSDGGDGGSIGGHANKVELQPPQIKKTRLSKQMKWKLNGLTKTVMEDF
jgi:hypothetical protein